MKEISEDEILRMTGNRGGSVSVGVGSGGNLAGYATQAWTEEYYINKEFFSSLFKVYDANNNEIIPNDTDSTIDNIKAMVGFWTEFYVSALGTGGQSTVGLRLSQLADVNVAGVTNGQVLTYDTTSGKWIASTPQSGTDMATVWSNLAANGNQQINYSHLSGAVSLSNGTITIGSSSITPITSHQSLAGYAKEAWVGQNYLPLTGGTITGSLTVNNTLSTGGNTTVGGDLKVNGGDLTVNEPNSSGASAIWFQSGGTTYGNLRVKASNGEFYFYNGSTGDGQSSACVNAGWFYAYGQVTALSDERYKTVIGDVELTVEQIAAAPVIRFTWKDRDDDTLQVGSIAQYWQKVLPESVAEKEDRLSFGYGVAGLVSGVVVARKVMDLEKRLSRLEKMFAITNDNDSED